MSSPRQFAAGLFVCLAVLAVPNALWATSEADPNPGPPLSPDSLTPREELTPTRNFGSRVAPAASVEVQAVTPPPQGALSGRIIFTSGGHGWTYGTSWNTERPAYQGIVEDVANQDQMTMFVDYCFRAGATVVPMRPVGNQTNEVIVDTPSASFSGSWNDGTYTPYYGSATPYYRSSTSAATESATARFTPNIPQAGFYPVYCWALSGTNRCTEQLYRISHTGGINEVRVNHARVGKGWVYLGTYYFAQGTGGYCEISNQSTNSTSKIIIADAIRFGNGMGDLPNSSTKSGFPREDEACKYWVQKMNGTGGDTSVYDEGNVGCPIRTAAYMNDSSQGTMTDRVYIGWHSNGSTGTADASDGTFGTSGSGRGVVGLYNKASLWPGTYTPNQQALAQLVGDEVNNDMVAIGTPTLEVAWSNRTSANRIYSHTSFAYGEINNETINDEFDATMCETAFHDNSEDSKLLRSPLVRDWASRAVYQAAVRYFNTFGGGSLVFLPDAPTNVRAIANGTNVTVSWANPNSPSYAGGAPTGYVVYESADGFGFGNPIEVSGGSTTSHTFTGVTAGQTKYYRVTAKNSGGESKPSEVLAVHCGASGAAQVLIVNGFDRFDRTLAVYETQTNSATRKGYRVKPWKMNAFNYAVQHAKALALVPATFSTASNEAVIAGQVSLSGYQAVVWICGKEASGTRTFDATEQSLVSTYLTGGGRLFASGSDIGYDLEAAGNGLTFLNNSLGGDYVADDAGTYSAGAGSNALAGITSGQIAFTAMGQAATAFPPINAAPYDANECDTLSPSSGSLQCLLYSTGAGAGVQRTSGSARSILLGIPFETIISPTVSANVMSLAMTYLGLNQSAVPDWALY